MKDERAASRPRPFRAHASKGVDERVALIRRKLCEGNL